MRLLEARQKVSVTDPGRFKLTVTNLFPSSRLICHFPHTYNSPELRSKTELTRKLRPSFASKVVKPCMAILYAPLSVPSHKLPFRSSPIGPESRDWSIGYG